MTVETRTTIELGDINAVEFECKNCRTKTVRQLDKLQVPTSCDNCGDRWFIDGNPESGELGFFIKKLQYYGSHDFRYALRFQIATLPHGGQK